MSNSDKENNSAPIINDKITVRNYKCFDEEGAGFDRIMPINVIIGKNNSGKSSLIELVEYIVRPSKFLVENGRKEKDASVLIEHPISKDEANRLLQYDKLRSAAHSDLQHNEFKMEITAIINKPLKWFLLEDDTMDFNGTLGRGVVGERLKEIMKKTPIGRNLYRIAAERDIQPENKSIAPKLINGVGATNYIKNVLTKAELNSDIVEVLLLDTLNEIINPDIRFSRILVQTNSLENDKEEEWEIFFENSQNNKIALSKMGSGIKTILLVLLNMIVVPELDGVNQSNMVFAFEELENNLHPALQRRLYQYIKEYSEKHGCYFFLTTHSNVVIDVFGTYEHAQIIHIENDGERSTTKTILHDKDSKKVLKDLGVKASDLLQSNGVIWVEGPSDRNYLNKWIRLLAPDLQEGLHYSIMFYGGRLLANLSFDFEWFDKKIISLLKINTNSFVVMDRDGKDNNAKLNATKKRIREEIGEGNCWVTKGREIENYLSNDVIKNWLSNNYEIKLDNFSNKINTKLENSISTEENGVEFKYNSSKTVYSSQIAEFIDKKSLDFLDLREKLDELIKRIIEWNE